MDTMHRPVSRRMVPKGVRVVPSKLPQYARVDEKYDLYDENHDDEYIDEELNRRVAAYDRAKTSTMSHLTSTMLRRSVGILDRCGLFMIICVACAIAFLSLSMIFELAYPFDSDPDVLYEYARARLITLQSFSDLALDGANVAVDIVQPLIPFWNAMSAYVVEPTIFILVEIVSLVSTGIATCSLSSTRRIYLSWIRQEASDVTLESDQIERAFSSQAWCGLMATTSEASRRNRGHVCHERQVQRWARVWKSKATGDCK